MPIFRPRVDKSTQLADIYGNPYKFRICTLGTAENYGGLGNSANRAIPIDNFAYWDKSGGLIHVENNGSPGYQSSEASPSYGFGSGFYSINGSSTTLPKQASPSVLAPISQKILLPYGRRGFTIRGFGIALPVQMVANGSGYQYSSYAYAYSTVYAAYQADLKAVQADGTTRTLASITTNQVSTASGSWYSSPYTYQQAGYGYRILGGFANLATSQAVLASERLVIDLTPSGNTVETTGYGGSTTAGSVVLLNRIPASYFNNSYATNGSGNYYGPNLDTNAHKHFEGVFSTLLLDIAG